MDCRLCLQAYRQRVNDAIAQVPGPADGIFMDNVEGLRMSGVEASTHVSHAIGKATTLDVSGWVNVNRHAFEPYASVCREHRVKALEPPGACPTARGHGGGNTSGLTASNCTTPRTIGQNPSTDSTPPLNTPGRSRRSTGRAKCLEC